MKTYKEKAYTVKTIGTITCDICGLDVNGGWGDGIFIEETEVSYTSGTSYGNDRSVTIYSIDICPKCFVKKLIPWLESHGATINEDEEER